MTFPPMASLPCCRDPRRSLMAIGATVVRAAAKRLGCRQSHSHELGQLATHLLPEARLRQLRGLGTQAVIDQIYNR